MRISNFVLVMSMMANALLGIEVYQEKSLTEKVKNSVASALPKATSKAFATGCMIALGQTTHISPDDPMYPTYMEWCEKNGLVYGKGRSN